MGDVELRKLRTKLGYTQETLGERIGVEQPYISRLENGEIEFMTIGKLKIISCFTSSSCKAFRNIIERRKEREKWLFIKMKKEELIFVLFITLIGQVKGKEKERRI